MNEFPKLSICTITYNHEDYVAQAIESFLEQKTNFAVEIVISDDSSRDKTPEIIEKYRNEYPGVITTKLRQKNVGLAYNWAEAILSCTGEYIAVCEGDDYWIDPYKLQKQVDFLENNPDYGMISSDIVMVNENGVQIPDNEMLKRQRNNRKDDISFFDLLQTNLINTLTICARSSLIKPLAKRIIDEELWFVYDYWFWLHLSLITRIHISKEKMAAYRVHINGISKQTNFFKRVKPYVYYDILSTLFRMKFEENSSIYHSREKIILNVLYYIIFNKFAPIKIRYWAFLNILKYYSSMKYFLI